MSFGYAFISNIATRLPWTIQIDLLFMQQQTTTTT
jgi:hypothetical protein